MELKLKRGIWPKKKNGMTPGAIHHSYKWFKYHHHLLSVMWKIDY